MARDIVLLVNPIAGGTRGLRVLAPVVDRLADGGARIRVLHGHGQKDSRDLAYAAVSERPDALVIVGGDGLVHLALQAAVDTEVPVGIVPAGGGNDIARVLGVPDDPVAAAEIILDGVVRAMDAGRCGGEWFASVLCAGFDARVSARVNRMTRLHGRARYLAGLAAELKTFAPIPFAIELDGEEWRTEAMLVAVGNTSTYGAGMRVCPQARPDDGTFDVTVVGRVSRAELVRVFPLIYTGGHVRHPAVTTARARIVSLTAPGLTAYADGEPAARLPVTCETVPGAWRVFVPEGNISAAPNV
ncbi:MAG: diacylglycerol/lipid kinase family protein [Streptosporangiaceae bacterium]